MSRETLRLQARWIFPVDREPIERGVLEIENGRIAAVHARCDPRAVDLGDVAILPGLVNAHTHLEFSDMPGPLAPPRPFSEWIRRVVAHRRGRTSQGVEAIRQGLSESLSVGVTALGEIATTDVPAGLFTPDAPRAVVFRELIGTTPERFEEQFDIAERHLTAASDEHVMRGISPHAPYSVHPELFERLVDLAARHRAPVAVHLAET
ncbi:MAG: amidohydrolase family protein, partial [Planctomycetaceae bacterium]